jgi:hypothetical protein
MFGNSPPRSKDQKLEIETDSDRKQEKSKKKSKKRKKESTEKPVKIPETAIIGATYKPRDLSVNMEKDIDLPLDQIRKVLWEDYDGSTQYGKNFIVPVRGYRNDRFVNERVLWKKIEKKSSSHFSLFIFFFY